MVVAFSFHRVSCIPAIVIFLSIMSFASSSLLTWSLIWPFTFHVAKFTVAFFLLIFFAFGIDFLNEYGELFYQNLINSCVCKIFIPLALFALAQGLRSAGLSALLARVFTETPVSRFYSLLPRDWVLEIIVIVQVQVNYVRSTNS